MILNKINHAVSPKMSVFMPTWKIRWKKFTSQFAHFPCTYKILKLIAQEKIIHVNIIKNTSSIEENRRYHTYYKSISSNNERRQCSFFQNRNKICLKKDLSPLYCLKSASYHSLQCSYGPFSSTLQLPKCYSRTLHTSSQSLGKKNVKRKPIVYSKKATQKVIEIWKNMTVQELANTLGKTVDDVFEIFIYVNDTENFDDAKSVITDLKALQQACKLAGFRFKIRPEKRKQEIQPEDEKHKDVTKKPPPPVDELESRAPIVTIMGHVDHGKTTLLDTLRHSSIVDTEFGGITQHIGAFEVSLPSGEQVTFLDTPGHAAFSAMRARGAQVTDLIVLVVAADDGVCPQTEESIRLAKDSGTPIIVAINKVDKPEANVESCKRMMLNADLQLEEQGGDVQAVEISALKGTNIPLLVETLVTHAELMDLKSTQKGLVEGIVIESRMDSKKGKIATCIILRGTLTKGAILVCGLSWAKVRSLFSSLDQPIEKALPGTPVQVIGWRDDILPSAGDEMLEVDTERRAKSAISHRQALKKREKGEEDGEAAKKKLEQHLVEYRELLDKKRQMGIRRKIWKGRPPLEKQFKDDPTPRVSLVLKGDVDGSLEAILDVLDTFHSDSCRLDLLSYSVGDISPGDVELAKSFNGFIYCFNAPLSSSMKQRAKESSVQVKQFNIIYRLIEDLKREISRILPLVPSEVVIGEAEVQQEFLVSEGRRRVPVAGCRCTKGSLKKSETFRVYRGSEVMFEGKLASLRHLKREVDSIKMDVECGVRFESEEFRFFPGDRIVCFKTEMVPQETDWDPEGF